MTHGQFRKARRLAGAEKMASSEAQTASAHTWRNPHCAPATEKNTQVSSARSTRAAEKNYHWQLHSSVTSSSSLEVSSSSGDGPGGNSDFELLPLVAAEAAGAATCAQWRSMSSSWEFPWSDTASPSYAATQERTFLEASEDVQTWLGVIWIQGV